ncbi:MULTISPECIES: S9 family peptidase [Microbacterium]|uniref:S9 family peptidase n=1 Tax=Microbacterium TaxID=33882 RepID=UPI00217EC4C5|nr:MULTISPECIES: S9 family peptidase [Microbacterium]UWF78319.1 S9 family peptidase [Microbacterium neungamense]WCM56496.1 S9 family peptidase [Microbacterium sp. EF45047]
MTDSRPTPPLAARRIRTRTHHGDSVDDPYEWLRAKDDPEVIAHLEAENAYTAERTAHLEPLRERLFQEVKSRVLETDLSVPTREGDWWYYGRTEEGAQYGIHCRTAARGDDWTPPVLEPGVPVPGEQVLLDGNAEAEGHDFFALGAMDVSDDGRMLLWSTDFDGSEVYTVHVRDLTTGERLADEIPNTAQAFFTPDGRAVLYTTRDEAWRPDTLWLHRLGTSIAEDVKLFHEPDERFWLGAGITRSRRYLVIGLGSKITSEELLVDLSDLTAPPRVVWPRREGVEYSLDHAVVDGEDRLLILHNDGALDFELVSVPASDPQAERTVILPHVPGRRLLEVDCFRDFATVEYRREGLARAALLDYRTGGIDEVSFDEPLYEAYFSGNPEWHAPFLRMGYGSFVTPATVLELEVATGERHIRKQQPVLGGYEPAAYGQRRDWAEAPDGSRVPISLVWNRAFGEPGEEPRPLHLYGYGSYEHSIDPGFSAMRLSMLDRGVVFAVAHVRGGGEMGRSWYEDGKLLNKKNTFTDFIACARHLVAAGVTTPERMVAEGGSAGGLLMGAAANLAPELFAGILAAVPFVDALTSILDPSLPLTVVEWDEWGDPLHDPDVYAYMKSYSPYENVREGVAYPRILAMTSLNDTRVLYVEPAKWVARLREAGAADVLLKCEMSAGHGGVSGRYNAWRERAFELAWMLDVLGLADAEPVPPVAP